MSAHRGRDLPLDPGHFRAMREVAGLTQQDIAQWAGVTDRSARRWDVTHTTPDEVARFVIDAYEDVREMARETLATGANLVPAGGTSQERAVARLVMVLAAEQGRAVRVVGP